VHEHKSTYGQDLPELSQSERPLQDQAFYGLPRVLDALKERGLITRTRSRDDARAVQILLTEQGRDLFAQVDQTRRNCLREVFDLDQKDLEDLVRVWRRLHG
jgi:DNA-binding MarR family transcriptional regulator